MWRHVAGDVFGHSNPFRSSHAVMSWFGQTNSTGSSLFAINVNGPRKLLMIGVMGDHSVQTST
jgi:hypothetical protein